MTVIADRPPSVTRAEVAVVIIGRNEAARLGEAIRSFPEPGLIVYVDSHSTDSSIDVARSLGVAVVELPASVPPSAAAARNAGFGWAVRSRPTLRFVQFLDGDCVLNAAWIDAAVMALEQDARLGAVWGWRSEKHPRQTRYNRICDMEWAIPPSGLTRHFGGDVMIRVEAMRQSGGFRPSAISSEDHDLSLRLSAAGWLIRRLDRPMTTHDAGMTRLRQWWRRCRRKGAGYVIVWTEHRQRPELTGILRSLFWALLIPAGIMLGAFAWGPSAFLAAAVYPLRAIKIAAVSFRARTVQDRLLWGIHCVAASLPYSFGIIGQGFGQLRRRPNRLIEYRGP